ncbi:fimbria major subunit, partial [Bacteroides sp.]
AGYNFAGITSNSSIKDCLALGLHKYENGICYYVASIKTGDVEKIVRNNSYQLRVSSIAQIGTVLPETIGTSPLLELSVEVNAWTTNLNAFDL